MSVMFCKNCGKQTPDGVDLCSECKEVISTAENTGIETPEVSIAQEAPVLLDEPTTLPKKKSKKKLIVSLISVVVALSIIITTSPYIVNAMAKLFMSPSQYFAYVVNKNFEDVADVAAYNLDLSKDYMTNGASANGKIELELCDSFGAFAEDNLNIRSSYIDWLENASIGFTSSTKDQKMVLDMDLSLNDVSLGKITTVMDMEDQEVYFAIPDYNPDFIGGRVYSSDFSDSVTANTVMEDIFDAMPNKAATKKLLTKYVKCLVKNIKNVDEEYSIYDYLWEVIIQNFFMVFQHPKQ